VHRTLTSCVRIVRLQKLVIIEFTLKAGELLSCGASVELTRF